MHENRRRARDWLNGASLTDFTELVREAKIPDDDMAILSLKFVHGYSNTQIAVTENLSIDKVNKVVKKAYDKIARLLDVY